MTKIINSKLLKFGFLIFAPEAHPPLAENLFGPARQLPLSSLD